MLRFARLVSSVRPLATPLALRSPLLAPRALVPAARCLCSGATIEVPIPELGAESIVEGGILSIAKSVGDYVAAEEMVAEIETGASMWPHILRTKR